MERYVDAGRRPSSQSSAPTNHERKGVAIDGWNVATPYLLLECEMSEGELEIGGAGQTARSKSREATIVAQIQGGAADEVAFGESPLPRVAPDVGQFDKYLAVLDPTLGGRPADSVGKLQNLLALIDGCVPNILDRKNLRQLIVDAQPRQSKWYDPNKPGQAELYDALERVLVQLKSFTPHSLPFLHRVNRKEVPDYYDVIKRPMDLSTMMKKLRSFVYLDRNQFLADLELIYDNCYTYNSHASSPFRKHVDFLKERWTVLFSSIPDITLRGADETTGELLPSPLRDDLDSILTAHLDKLDDESSFSNSQPTTPRRVSLLPASSSSSSTSSSPTEEKEGEREEGLEVEVGEDEDEDEDEEEEEEEEEEGNEEENEKTVARERKKGERGKTRHRNGRRKRLRTQDKSKRSGAPASLQWRLPARSAAGMGEYYQKRMHPTNVEFSCFHQCFPDGIKIARTTQPLPLDWAVDEAILQQCERFRSIRSTMNPATAPSGGQGPLTRVLLPTDCFSPTFCRQLVSSRMGWMLLQAGYESFIPEALSCLTDILVGLVEQMYHSLKLYIELNRIADPVVLSDHLVRSQVRSGTRQLLRFLTFEPRRHLEKLERVLGIVEEHKCLADASSSSAMAIEVEESELGEAVPDSDLDLGLLGEDPSLSSSHPSLLNMVSFSANRRKREVASLDSPSEEDSPGAAKWRPLDAEQEPDAIQPSPGKKPRPDPAVGVN